MPKLYSNTSSLVASQLPDYIRGDYISYVSGNNQATADYSKFINFVEAYYKFLEKETYPTEVLQNAKEYSDVEKTINNANVSLVESFFKNYGYDIPRNLLVDNKAFVKHFNDIYKTKGSEQAAQLLFRVLYGVDASFTYPSERILKPSDGEWVKYYTLKVDPINNSNVFNFLNTRITGMTSKATAKVKDVLKLQINSPYYSKSFIYELYLEDIKGTFVKETLVSSYSSSTQANTIYQVGYIKVIDGGKGYTLQNEVTHEGSISKISKVDDEGTIQLIDVIDSGAFLLSSSFANASHNSFFTVTTDNPLITITGDITLNNNVGIFTSNVHHGLKRNDLTRLEFYGNSNSILNLTPNNITITRVIDDKRFTFSMPGMGNTRLSANLVYTTKANLYATFDILKITNGFYIKEKGQPSSSYVIQGFLPNAPDTNVLYYQPYSYVISSPEPVSKWRDIIRSTIHPSGMEVFGDVLLETTNENKLSDTGKSEITDYLSITADNFSTEYTGDSVSISFSPTLPRNYSRTPFSGSVTVPMTADHVNIVFGYL